MAYDLEIWFIRSILFIGIAPKLGPKLVMIRKMVRMLYRDFCYKLYHRTRRQTISYYLCSSLLLSFLATVLHQDL